MLLIRNTKSLVIEDLLLLKDTDKNYKDVTLMVACPAFPAES